MSTREEEHIASGGKIRSVILGLNDGLIFPFLGQYQGRNGYLISPVYIDNLFIIISKKK